MSDGAINWWWKANAGCKTDGDQGKEDNMECQLYKVSQKDASHGAQILTDVILGQPQKHTE